MLSSDTMRRSAAILPTNLIFARDRWFGMRLLRPSSPRVDQRRTLLHEPATYPTGCHNTLRNLGEHRLFPPKTTSNRDCYEHRGLCPAFSGALGFNAQGAGSRLPLLARDTARERGVESADGGPIGKCAATAKS